MATKKVLVVDDEIHWRNLFRSFLQDYNFEIFEAYDGQSGVDRAKTVKPDLIILDNKMPNMTGLEAARIFRSEPLTKNTPIIMATAMEFTETMVDYIKMDVHEFIKKPFDVKELLVKIEKLTGSISHKAEFTITMPLKKKILTCFIDDKNKEFALSQLTESKYEISNAKDSSELLKKVTNDDPDVIMTGASHAGWSSYMGVKLLQNSLLKNIPIIMDLADSESDELTKTVSRTGKRFFIIQPIEPREIEQHLSKLRKEIEIN